MTRILVVDNYDSFVYNLVQYLGQLGAEVVVRRNDAVTPGRAGRPRRRRRADLARARARRRTPAQSMAFVTACAERGTAAVRGVPGPPGDRRGVRRRRSCARRSCCTARPARSSTTAPACWPGCRRRSPPPATTRWPSRSTRCRPRSWSPAAPPSGVVMALRHATLPIEGVQFHPESVLTQGGHRMVANWLRPLRRRRRRGPGRSTLGDEVDDDAGRGVRHRLSAVGVPDLGGRGRLGRGLQLLLVRADRLERRGVDDVGDRAQRAVRRRSRRRPGASRAGGRRPACPAAR